MMAPAGFLLRRGHGNDAFRPHFRSREVDVRKTEIEKSLNFFFPIH